MTPGVGDVDVDGTERSPGGFEQGGDTRDGRGVGADPDARVPRWPTAVVVAAPASMSPATTEAPRRRPTACARARPIPEPAPVMTATLPSICMGRVYQVATGPVRATPA